MTHQPDQKVNVSQCLDCGAIFNGNHFTACPICEGVNFTGNLDIQTAFYGGYPFKESMKKQLAYYEEALGNGIIFEQREQQ